MYPDCTSLCYQTSDINNLNNAINNDLMQLDTWPKGNKLSLNVAKTNCIIKTALAKVSKAIGFLRHAKAFLPQETLKTLYTGIVEPHFRYCCSFWVALLQQR